jgi:GAF domain-containing protein/CheY-like chemotaxis protein
MYQNPFVYKRPLYPLGDELVTIERPALLQKVITHLKFGQWLSVCSARKMGKTSFLLRVIHESQKLFPGWHFIIIRAEDFSSFTVEEFQRQLLSKLNTTLTPSPNLPLSSQSDTQGFVSALSAAGGQLAENQKVVIIFDRLENAPRTFVQTILRLFINVFQAQYTDNALTKFQMIISSSLPPNEFRLSNGLSFYECAVKTDLDDFLYEDVEDMIQRVAAHLDVPCQNGFTRLLYEMTSGSGYLVQKICYRILEAAFLANAQPEFSLKNGDDAMFRIMREGETVPNLTIEQVEKRNGLVEALVRTLRNGTIVSDNHDPALQALVSIGALSHRNGTYRIRNQIFERIFQDYFNAERLANRYYDQKNYHRAKELFFDSMAQQDNAKKAMENLHACVKSIGENSNQEDLVTRILHAFASSIEGTEICALLLVDKNKRKLKIIEALGLSADFLGDFQLNYGEGVSGLAVLTGRTRVIRDVSDEVECPEFVARKMAQERNLGAMISLPVQFGGEVLGVINLCLRKPHEFSHSEIKMLEILAAQASIALQNGTLHQSLERQQESWLELNRTIQILDSHIDSQFVFESILESAQFATGFEKTYLVWKDVHTASWHFVFPKNLSQNNHIRTPDVRNGEGIVSVVLKTGEPYLVSDVHNEESYFAIWDDVKFEYAIPVMSDGEIVGCMAVAGSNPKAFSEMQQIIFLILASLASFAIKKQRLYGIAEKKTQQVITLKAIGEVISNEKREHELLNLVAKECLKVVARSNKAALILLFDKVRNKLMIRAAGGEQFGKRCVGMSLSMKEPSLAAAVLRDGKPHFVNDLELETEYRTFAPEVLSEIAVPLVFHDEILGVIDVQSTQKGSFDIQDQESLIAIANSAAVAIKISELCHRRLMEFEALYQTGTKITAGLNIGDIMRTVCVESLNAIGNENRKVSVQILHPDDQNWIIKLAFGPEARYIKPSKAIMERNGALRWATENKRHCIIPSVPAEPAYVPEHPNALSAIMVPIVFNDRPIGIIVMESIVEDDFGDDELKLLQGLANQAGVALENARLSQDLAKTQVRLSKEFESLAIEEGLAGLVHDIKNISTQIVGETQWLEKCERENKLDLDEVKQAMKKINSYVNNIEKFTDSVRNRAYKLPAELKLKNLKEVIEEAQELVSGRALRSGVDIRGSEADFNVELYVDAGRLARAFFNIMTNAIDAMPRGGTLDIRSQKCDGCIEIDFTDSGEGIPRDILNKVLSPFVTTREGGYGLGLTITKYIVEVDHKGTLKLESNPGQGTTVRVRIPLDPRQHVNRDHDDQKNGGINPSVKLQVNEEEIAKKRVLVVNDDDGMLEKIEKSLRYAGYVVTGTEYGTIAVDLCREEGFDVIIFDYHLKKDESPTSTALDFIPEIRKFSPLTPIILTSASLESNPVSQGVYDHFLQINAEFWDALPPLVHQSLKNRVKQLEFQMN